MNKRMMLAAFAVLLMGFAFAVPVNASGQWISESKFNVSGAYNDSTEGGNVTFLNLSTTASTEKWAGYVGNVTGSLVLAQQGDTQFLYTWAWAGGGGYVCASTNPVYSFTAGLSAASTAALNTVWDFGTQVDNATNTFNASQGTFSFAGIPAVSSVPRADTGLVDGFLTGVMNNTAPTLKDAFTFCVAINNTGTNYKGGQSQYELIVPTNETFNTFENYYFYLELV